MTFIYIGLCVKERVRFLAKGAGVDGCEETLGRFFGGVDLSLALNCATVFGDSGVVGLGDGGTRKGAPCLSGTIGDMLSVTPANALPPATIVEFFKAGYRLVEVICKLLDLRVN